MSQRAEQSDSVGRSNSVGRGLAVVEMLAPEPQGLGVAEIARRLGADVGQTHRILRQVIEAGWVAQRSPSSEYELSERLLTSASDRLRNTVLRQVAVPFIDELASRCGETVHLAEWRQGNLVCIARMVIHSPVVATAEIGETWSLDGSSAAAVAVRSAILRGLRHSSPVSIALPDDPPAERAVQVGFGRDDGTYRSGVQAVAAPITNLEAEVVGALIISTPSQRADEARIEELGEMVREAAEQISRALGATRAAGPFETVRQGRTKDLFRHLTDLRHRTYEGAEGRSAQEAMFRRAVDLMTPVVFESFDWINQRWLDGSGSWRHLPDVPTDDGLRSEWTLTWPELDASRDRFTGAPLAPVRVVAYLLAQHIHGHLRGEYLGDWPLQVVSEADAWRQTHNVFAAIEGDLHEKIFLTNGDWMLIPAYAASVRASS